MVEVLILSYNALPLDVVSSYRTKAYCDHFADFGIRPTLLTHRWEYVNGSYVTHAADDAVITEEDNGVAIIRLPYPGVDASKSRMHTLVSYLDTNIDVGLMSSYRIFKHFLFNHLKTKKYDVIIGIYNPHFHLKLAYECWLKFKIPYVLDFRDLWDNDIVTPSYRPDFTQRVVNLFVSHAWKKWLKPSLFFATTGSTWLNFIGGLSGKEGIIVRNGFDKRMKPSEKVTVEKFIVVHFGRLYKGQDLATFLSGFKAFAEGFTTTQVGLEIVGLKTVHGVDWEGEIKAALGEYVRFIPYKPKEELMRYCSSNASLFFFPNFREDNGQFPVKLYDYIQVGRNIMVSPAGGAICDFVRETNVGVVANTAEDVKVYLQNCYMHLRNFGCIPYEADWEELEAYTRKKQVKLMADKIHQVFSGIAWKN